MNQQSRLPEPLPGWSSRWRKPLSAVQRLLQAELSVVRRRLPEGLNMELKLQQVGSSAVQKQLAKLFMPLPKK